MQIKDNFMLDMGHLYELREDDFGQKAWIHVMVVRPGVNSIGKAIKEFQREDPADYIIGGRPKWFKGGQ